MENKIKTVDVSKCLKLLEALEVGQGTPVAVTMYSDYSGYVSIDADADEKYRCFDFYDLESLESRTDKFAVAYSESLDRALSDSRQATLEDE